MPLIRPNRESVDNRFSVLGFTIRTESPLYEVAIASDPQLFRPENRARRGRGNFYSSRTAGALRARRGEAVWMVPPEVLSLFVGQQRLYFGLATYREGSGGVPDFVQVPSAGHMYIDLSGLTERGLRRLAGRPAPSAGYGMRAYCQNGGAGCLAGISLLTAESNYRALYLRTEGGNQVKVIRLAPCNEQRSSIMGMANTNYELGIEYRGPEGGAWSYYFNGGVIDSMTSHPPGLGDYISSGVELAGSPNSDAVLNANPAFGIYTIAANATSYVEGAVSNVSVVALTKATPAAVSASTNFSSATNATDGNTSTAWVASTGGAQWIELDLGSTKTIRKLRFLTEQTPSGSTVHDVYVGNSPGSMALAYTFSGYTTTRQWLDKTFMSSPPSGRYVRIHTSVSPSWVAWREVQVFAE